MNRTASIVLLTAMAVTCPREAFAAIMGGAGNRRVADPGWPRGAAAIFNHPGRIAWWEGPPFGGGQWHAECRGDARQLNAVLDGFAGIDVKSKRVVIHDGIGHSFWLAPNNEPEKLASARIDWSFTVWQPASWEQLRKLPADLNPTGPGDDSPPSQIDIYAGGLDGADVAIPEGIAVDDRRLSSHGFTAADGVVIEGKVTDLSTGRPIAATMRLERVEPQKTGGYLYPAVAEARADAQGRWVLKKTPPAWVRVVVESEGFAPRVVGYAQIDDQPRWMSFDCGLSRAAPVSGRVVDQDGQPLAGVNVRLDDLLPKSGGRYELPIGAAFKTDAGGRFRADRMPAGSATIWIHKSGYCRPGLGLPIEMPKADVELKMSRSSGVRVMVTFPGGARVGGYIVTLEPEGGPVVGSYGGSGELDARNEISFKDVPPGRYVLKGRPNPGSDDQQTDPFKLDLKGGQPTEVILKAK